MDIHWHDTTVKVLDAHSQLHLNKSIHPMDIHWHGTTVEQRDAHSELPLNK
jgi:hypothetical protein